MGNGVSSSGSTDGMVIEELKYQCNPWNRKHPTIRLSWQTPICQVSPRDIEYVIYANDQELQVVHGPVSSVVLSTLTPLKSYNFKVTARHRQTKEEGLYYQSFEVFLDWKCKRLECEKSRWVITDPIYLPENEEALIYEYCSVQDKAVWEMDHCLHSECRRCPAPNSFFCDDERDAHRFLAKQKGGSYVMCQPSSRHFQEMEKTFLQDWDKSKGLNPIVCLVIAIINPTLEDRLAVYKSSLKRTHQKTQYHYHGTKLKCPLHKYYVPCQQKECGVCGISRNGFLLDCASDDCRHFATAFYLAPTSSKCHNYCATTISHDRRPQRATRTATSNPYYAMIYSEVAPGKKYHLKHRENFLSGPPDGYNTVYGKSSEMPFLHGDGKNEELVVFNEEAISPKYIICYKVSQP